MRDLGASRIFSAQLEDHDGLFGPKRKVTGRMRLWYALLLLPAILFFLMPSFKLGRVETVTPPFPIPDTLSAGQAFTIPFDSSIVSVQAQGRGLQYMRRPAMWIGATPSQPSLNLDIIFKTPTHKWSAKSLLPHFEHPSASIFSKNVKIEAATAPALAPSETPVQNIDLSVLSRTDGPAEAACWAEPKLTIVETMLAKHYTRHEKPRLATVTTSAAGEVTKIEAAKDGEKTIAIYHGGGLYSVYGGLKELRVRTGEKIGSGQALGVATFATHKVPFVPNWTVYLDKSALNPESFLALSSQLCDLK